MPAPYIPLLIFALLSAAFPFVALAVVRRMRAGMDSAEATFQADESEIAPKLPPRAEYSGRFYLVAVMFVIFDVATIFLFPWAVKFSELGVYGLLTMLLFLGVLIAGYFWLYRVGALDWT